MTPEVALILGIDGLANGAVYLLAGLGLVLIFSVTRVVFVPFGDVAAFAALSLAAFETGRMPATVWMVATLAVLALAVEVRSLVVRGESRRIPRALVGWGLLPALPCLAAWAIAGRPVPALLQVAIAVLLVVPIIPLVARVALQPIADASVLVLLIASLALHFLLSGLGLLFFGPEGSRTAPLIGGALSLGGFGISHQVLLMVGAAVVLSALFFLAFERTIAGKALRATAVNRLGARLMGISATGAGRMAFAMAAFIGALSGLLIGPTTTIFYDSGFLIGLKGFVAAVFAGLASYPLALVGALGVGLLESFGSFWASAFKEVIVFTAIIPVLLWRSLRSRTADEDEE